MATIRLEAVCKRYGEVDAVSDLSLACADGELLALLGPSGCGKTSTLKMVAGIEDVSAGEIYFDDRPVSALDAAARNVAMVFEDYALYPHLTVAGNIAFPLEVRGWARAEIRRAVDAMTTLLGLQALRDVGVRQLSGGAQQRVAIGRALVREPAVILFDEPLSHLDASHKVQLRAEIKRLQQDTAVTGVLVTHDQTEAMAMADRVAVMNLGVLQQLAVPQDLYDHPANLFVAQFIGEPPMNLFAGRLVESSRTVAIAGDGWRAALPPPMAAAARAGTGDVVVGARPEEVRLGRIDGPLADGALAGRVFFREPRGDVDVVLVTLDRPPGAKEGVVTVEIPSGAAFKEGDAVEIGLPAHALHVFDAQSGRNLLAAPSAA
jgi:ABC-type sugar transport system ATPase subunit